MRRRDFLWLTAGATAHWSLARATPVSRSLLDALGASLPATTLDGSATTVPTTDVADFARRLRGRVILAGDPDYDQARRVWNGQWDRWPALVARCESPADVIESVNFAREHRLLTAVRAGGHSLTGKSTCDGGIVIDLTPMSSVRVDPAQRWARIESGTLLRDLDHETQAFSLVTTAGTVGHTGAAGLTLGGGLGRVGRRFGLACDNLVAADVVTADGRLVHTSETQNPDLLWGLRGGGGNFGVVTSLEYALHPMNPVILGGLVVWPLSQARAVLERYAEFVDTAPDELNIDLMIVPGGPRAGVNVELCWSGDHPAGERAMAPLRSFGKPVIDTVGPLPYVALQTSADEFMRAGQIFYGKSAFVTTLTPGLIDRMVEITSISPPPRYALGFQLSGGAIGRVPVDATAFPNRRGLYWMMISELWTDRTESEGRVAEVRSAWSRVEPFTDGFYVNSMSEELYRRVQENYGPNYPRLQALKKRYDPGNQFRLNANITPA